MPTIRDTSIGDISDIDDYIVNSPLLEIISVVNLLGHEQTEDGIRIVVEGANCNAKTGSDFCEVRRRSEVRSIGRQEELVRDTGNRTRNMIA